MFRRALVSCILVSVAILSVVAACGGGADDSTAPPSNNVASTAIGPTGGTIQGAGVTLRVPEGAVSQTVTISITTSTDVAPDGYVATSPVYQFFPDGLVFSKPVAVDIALGADDGSASNIVWSTTAGGVEDLPSTVNGNVMTASVQHFSHGFIGHRRHDTVADASNPPDANPTPPTDAAVDATITDASTCHASGGSCDAGAQCCSGSCNGGTCGDAGAPGCGSASCAPTSQCCSGICAPIGTCGGF